MQTFKRILIGFLGLLALLFVISIFLPSKFKVERSLAINKPADTLFSMVNNLKTWQQWDPWERKDPTMTHEYLGPDGGMGATHNWKGKDGNGTLTILQSISPDIVIYQLQFEGFDPMQGRIEFDSETDSITNVKWVMEGDMGNNPIKKYFGLMMDRMMGPDFALGLKNLAK